VPPPFDPNHPELGNGSDLDNGWTGTSHNFPVIDGSSLKYCLTGCDSVSTFDCELSGTTAVSGDSNPLNGATFGAPLPLLAANVPVCVVNRFQDPVLTGHYNLQTGEAGTPDNPNTVNLFSDVYLRTSFTGEVCPRCNVPGGGGKLGDKGTCSSSAKNAGAACVVDGEVTVAGKGLYLLSSACTPLGGLAADLARHPATVHDRDDRAHRIEALCGADPGRRVWHRHVQRDLHGRCPQRHA
jgi:hypothetical protein